MEVRIIKALEDNYSYILIDRDSKKSGVIDGVGFVCCEKVIKDENLKLEMVLTTHHHSDHSGENSKWHKTYSKIPIYGSDNFGTKYPGELKLGDIKIKVLKTPCHTRDSVCLLCEKSGNDAVLFTGDTIFVSGCGHFFEGTAIEMLEIVKELRELKDETKVYVGHEYSISNLQYALTVEPENDKIQSKLIKCEKMLKENGITIPSTILDEKETNPFFRVFEKSVHKYANSDDVSEVMRIVRERKTEWGRKH